MHIVYLNNQQYIAQSVHATTIVSLLCVYILLRHTLKSLRNKSFSWRGLLGRAILSVYATLVAAFTLTFYKWPSFATYLAVIKGMAVLVSTHSSIYRCLMQIMLPSAGTS